MQHDKEYPTWVCSDCGLKASRAAGNTPPAFEVSTFHEGVCDVCGQAKAVTEPRDFFHPDFNKTKEGDKA